MPFPLLWLMILLLGCCPGVGAHARVLAVTGAEAGLNLAPAMDYLCESPGAPPLTIASLDPARFTPVAGPHIAFAYRQPPCWFRFRLANTQARSLALALAVPFSLLDDLQLYTRGPEGGWRLDRIGDRWPFGERSLAVNNPVFPLVLPASARVDYVLRVQTTSPFAVPVRLSGWPAFVRAQSDYELAIGVFYGVTVGLLLYSLVLWGLTRERSQGLYVLYLASSLIYTLWVHGLLFRLWPQALDWNNHGFYACILFTATLSLLFTREFLHLRARPALSRACVVVAGLTAGAAALLFGLPLALAARLAPALTLLVMALAIGASLRRWRDGDANAPLFLVAWGALLGAILYTIVMNNLGRGDITLSVHALQAGFAAQQILIAIGLARQVNALKEAKLALEQESRIARAESAAKSEFLARMSHEIRTPMNAVLGVSQLLANSGLNPEQREQVALLHSSGTQLLELINDILDFSRMGAERLLLEQIGFDLHALVDECARLFQSSAAQKGLRWSCLRGEDVPRWVRGDPVRIRQILFNLLGNALKFTAEGGIRLEVGLIEGGRHDARLRFSVSDTGIGMSAEQLQRLFVAFAQADTSITRQYGGSGLGLAISKQLAELMEGQITVRSQPGQGSTFSFEVTLALGEAPAAGPATGNETAVAGYPHLAGLRILVAEDSHINQVVIQAMLARLGITPTLVDNGQEALALLCARHDDFDLVLMDFEMPVLDGVEAVRQLRRWEQTHRQPRLYVMALTAHALPGYEHLCLQAGMDDFLSKPILLPQLLARLERFAADRRPPSP